MFDSDFILKLWPIILPLIVSLIWLIRLEARTLNNEKDIPAVEKRSNEKLETLREDIIRKDEMIGSKFDSLQSSLHRVLETLGEIKGKINHN